jgi:hypothetical protein
MPRLRVALLAGAILFPVPVMSLDPSDDKTVFSDPWGPLFLDLAHSRCSHCRRACCSLHGIAAKGTVAPNALIEHGADESTGMKAFKPI